MALTYGFYNSSGGDRKYNSEQISAVFNFLITEGVLSSYGDHFAVVPGQGRQVIVQSGWAWFDSTWTQNDSDLPLAIEPPDISVSRIDAVVIETNHNLDKRRNTIKIVQGTPSSNPQKPPLAETTAMSEHAIAYVTVQPSATSISLTDIEIVVGKDECPFCTSILQSTSIEVLFNQWEGEFDAWFEHIQTVLSEEVVTNLYAEIDKCVKKADKATEAEAKAGTNDTHWMTPAKVKSAVESKRHAVGSVIDSIVDISSDKIVKITYGAVDQFVKDSNASQTFKDSSRFYYGVSYDIMNYANSAVTNEFVSSNYYIYPLSGRRALLFGKSTSNTCLAYYIDANKNYHRIGSTISITQTLNNGGYFFEINENLVVVTGWQNMNNYNAAWHGYRINIQSSTITTLDFDFSGYNSGYTIFYNKADCVYRDGDTVYRAYPYGSKESSGVVRGKIIFQKLDIVNNVKTNIGSKYMDGNDSDHVSTGYNEMYYAVNIGYIYLVKWCYSSSSSGARTYNLTEAFDMRTGNRLTLTNNMTKFMNTIVLNESSSSGANNSRDIRCFNSDNEDKCVVIAQDGTKDYNYAILGCIIMVVKRNGNDITYEDCSFNSRTYLYADIDKPSNSNENMSIVDVVLTPSYYGGLVLASRFNYENVATRFKDGRLYYTKPRTEHSLPVSYNSLYSNMSHITYPEGSLSFMGSYVLYLNYDKIALPRYAFEAVDKFVVIEN